MLSGVQGSAGDDRSRALGCCIRQAAGTCGNDTRCIASFAMDVTCALLLSLNSPSGEAYTWQHGCSKCKANEQLLLDIYERMLLPASAIHLLTQHQILDKILFCSRHHSQKVSAGQECPESRKYWILNSLLQKASLIPRTLFAPQRVQTHDVTGKHTALYIQYLIFYLFSCQEEAFNNANHLRNKEESVVLTWRSW